MWPDVIILAKPDIDCRLGLMDSAKPQISALKVAACLWVIWGLVHMLAGVMVMAQTTSQGFAVIADAIDPMLLVAEHHPAVGGVLGQHGFNLFWFGAVTLIGAIFI